MRTDQKGRDTMKKHKCTSICITVVAVLLLACGTALAAWNVSEYAVNLLSMSSYKNSIQENYVRPDHVDPGQKVVKEVNIKNEGTVDSFVRIKIGRVFGSISETGQFLENRELDPEMIEIHYNTDLWKLCEDGYWYYKDVLPAGKTTKKPLNKSFESSGCTSQQKVDTFFIFYTLKTEHSTPYIVLVSNSLMSMQVFLH